jgi:hypothetical protein
MAHGAMAEKDFRHRDVLDKLGIKPGFALAFSAEPRGLDQALTQRALERVGREPGALDEPLDVVLLGLDDSSDVVDILSRWRPRLDPAGGIWLLTPKRGQPGYVNQTDLILAGPAARLVDNKICSISDTESAMRFVIRKVDRV